MGGSIECESTPGIGSTFRFSALVAVKPGESGGDGGCAGGPGTNEPLEKGGRTFPDGQRMSGRTASPSPASPGEQVFGNTYNGNLDVGGKVICSPVAGMSPVSCPLPTGAKAEEGRGGGWCVDKEWRVLDTDYSIDRSNSSKHSNGGGTLSSITQVMATPHTARHVFDQETGQRTALFSSAASTSSAAHVPQGYRHHHQQQPDDILESHNDGPHAPTAEPTSAHDVRHGATFFPASSSRGPDETTIFGHDSSQRPPPRQHLTVISSSDSLHVSELLDVTALRPGSHAPEGVAVGSPDVVGASWWAESGAAFARKSPPVSPNGERDGDGVRPQGAEVLAGARRPRLLVVDDVQVNRMLLCKMLEALDVEVSP